VAITLAASFLVVSTASDLTTLTTSSFTPAAGDIIVVKSAAEAVATVCGTPTDTNGHTYTAQLTDTSASHCYAKLSTTTVTTATSMTVSAATTGTAGFHSMIVERWTGATLAGSPATNGTKTGTGAPSSTITTTAANSVVSWLNADFAAVSPASRTYNTTSATPTEDGIHDKSPTQYVAYYAWQTAATAASQTLGITAPTGQTWTLLGIELLASASGPAPDAVQAEVRRPWRIWGRDRSQFKSTYELFASRDVPAVLVPASLPVLNIGGAFAGPGGAPQPFLAASRDVTALQPSASPPPFLAPSSGRPAYSAPGAILFRSTADPAVASTTLPVTLVAPAPIAPPRAAAAPLVVASATETAVLEPPTIVSPAAAILARPAPAPILTRPTADPVVTADTPTAPLVARVTSSSPLAAPAPAVLVSRDVTPLQASSNPAAPIVNRALWATTAPPAIVTRSTADPVNTDSPTVPLVARAGSIAYPAPAPTVALARDVTPLQPSASPPPATIGRALWSTTAPPSLLTRSTADTLDVPPVPRLITAPAVRLPDLARISTWRQLPPPPIERRTDVLSLVAPQRPPDAARAWLLTPRAEPTIGPAPKAGGIEPGTRTSAGLAPGGRSGPGAAPGLHSSPGAAPGTRAGASIEPGTRTAAQIEGGP